MINKIFKVIMIFITSIIVLVMIVSQLLLRDALAPFKFAGYLFTYKYANYDINKKNDILEREKKVENDKAIKTYIINKYGEVLSQVIEVEYRGRRKGWHADSEYVLHFPFANDKVVYVESETQKIFTRDYDISTDVKFQHLYSEWVKKQVGIEDENVELKFAGYNDFSEEYNFKINFKNIKLLDKDYDELFKNVKNMKLNSICILNNNNLSIENQINEVIYKNIIPNYYYKVIRLLNELPKKDLYGRLRPHNIYIYINDIYEIVYDEEKKEITSRRKKNENSNDYNGEIWSNF